MAQTMPWDNDPIVEEDATTMTASPWEDDPIEGAENDTQLPTISTVEGETGEFLTDLPVPSTEMYANTKSPEEAAEVYKQYINHPDTERTITGGYSYKGTTVPWPEADVGPLDLVRGAFQVGNVAGDWVRENVFGAEPTVTDVTRDRAGAAVGVNQSVNQIPRVVAGSAFELGNALGDKTRELFGGEASNPEEPLIEIADLPETDNLAHQVVREGGAMALGGAGGASAMARITSSSGRFVKALGGLVGFEAGASVAGGKDVDPLVVGPNASIPLIGGLNSASPDEAQNIINERLNLLMDGALAAGAMEGGARSAIWLGGVAKEYLVKPLLNLTSKTALEDTVGTELLDQLYSAANATTPEEKDRLFNEVVQSLRANRERIVQSGEEGIPDMEVLLDTMSSIAEGLRNGDVTGSRELAIRLDELASGNAGPATQARRSQPAESLRGFSDNMEQAAGGPEAVTRGREAFQDSARTEESIDIDMPLDIARRMRDDANTDVEVLLRQDPTFGDAIKQLEGKVQFDILRNRTDAVDGIVERITEARREMDKQLQSRIDEIPSGVFIEEDAILGALDDAIQNGALPANSGITKRIRNSGGDFKTLYQDVVPRLSRTIDGFFKSGKVDEALSLIEVRDVINDTMAEVPEAQAFRDYYKNEYAPFWKDGPLSNIGNLYSQTVRRGDNIRPVDYNQGATDIVNNTFQESRAAELGQVIELLRRPEGGQSANLVTDVALGDVAANLRRLAMDGEKGISDVSVSNVAKGLEQFGSVLREYDPAQAARIDGFLENLRSSKNNIRGMDAQIEEMEQVAKASRSQLYETELKEFFLKNSDGTYREAENSYDIFQTLFTQDRARLTDLVARAEREGNELALNGMKAAFARHYRDAVFKTSGATGGRPVVNTGALRDSGAQDGILEVASVLYKNTPSVVDALREVGDLTYRIEDAAQAGATAIFSKTDFTKGARGVTDFGITQIFGVLNRVGSRIRSAAGRLISGMDPSERADKIMDMALADPYYFEEIIQRVKASQGKLTASDRKAIIAFFNRGIVYGEDDNVTPISEGQIDFMMNEPIIEEDNTVEDEEDFLQ